MNDSPRESGVTDDPTELSAGPWQDRWHRPVGWLGRAVSSSPYLSHAIAKCVTLPVILLEISADRYIYRRVSRDTFGGQGIFSFVEIASTSSSSARRNSQLRKPGGRGLTARNVEVGGSGGNGWTATAVPRDGDRRNLQRSRWLWRSLSVTCNTTPHSYPSDAVCGRERVSTSEIGGER